MSIKNYLKSWWWSLSYDPRDPRYGRGEIKIVAIGGGSGLSTLLFGLKKYSKNITAIVAATDSGKSSGVIRKVFKTLPPGDIRKCMAALSNESAILSDIFEYRFSDQAGVFANHPLGNIWIAALAEKFGSFEKSIELLNKLLDVQGEVMPSTMENVELCAKVGRGQTVVGEANIPKAGRKIDRVFFNKRGVKVYKKAKEAISNADLIIIGPGSLYTSILPNLIISGINEAIRENESAVKIFVSNISTERGETENYSVGDHVQAIADHVGVDLFKYLLVNNKVLKRSKLASKLGEIDNITTKAKFVDNYRIIAKNIISRKNPLYHDAEKLAKEIILHYNKVRKI